MTPAAGDGPAGRPAIGVLGEVLVEVMRPEPDLPLDREGVFAGPFASGAPAIFAAAAARLGAATRFAGVVGDDPFGRLCRRRLVEHGVDVQALRTATGAATGVAFVAYRGDGGREFLFHLPRAAAAELGPADVEALRPEGLAWLHLSGSSLGVSPSMRAACEEAARRVAAAGGTVAFDPNLRAELTDPVEARAFCSAVLRHAHVVLPSDHEAALLAGTDDPREGCRRLRADGVAVVILKRGAEGCTVFADGLAVEGVDVPAVPSEVRDPTGAGDVFAAGVATASVSGASPLAAVRLGGAAAAAAIETLGPMEGLADREACARRSGEG
jgi:sugar/nucleoside kinase (ribokinase family)